MNIALIGTAKGLIIAELAVKPVITAIHFKGFSVTMVHVEERTNTWWCGVSHKHWGQKLHVSEDKGRSWKEVPVPSFEGALLPDGRPAKLRQIWCMASGGKDHSGELWLGTDPGGLFRSTDNGRTFELVRGLWEHPSRKDPGKWFGAGSDHPFIHSIVVDPGNSDHVYIAVSCAGVFETVDRGLSWEARNSGLVAAYLPNPHVEIGHDPHLLLQHPKDTSVLWQQNHCGIFVSRNGGREWKDVSGKEGMPSYGFAIAIDEEDPSRAWVIPVESDEERVAPGLKLSVFETRDFGESWTRMDDGLPASPVFDIVLRQAFARRGESMIFGTTNGNLYYTTGKMKGWTQISAHLTKVNTVIIAEK